MRITQRLLSATRLSQRATAIVLCGIIVLLVRAPLFAQEDVATGPGSAPVSMRIMGVTRTADSMNIHVMLADSNGTTTRLLENTGSWSVSTRCRTEYGSTIPTTVRVNEAVVDVNASCMVVINNSLIEGSYPRSAVASVFNVFTRMDNKDSVGVMLFDEGSNIVAPLSSPASAAGALADGIDDPAGLAAVYSALASALSAVNVQATGSRAIVLITSSDDNASVVHNSSDIVRAAKQTGVAIHVIRIGSGAQGYVYRYMAHATGGRLVTIEPTAIDDIGSIVRDIVKSMHRYYNLAIAMPDAEVGCMDTYVQVGFTLEARSLADTLLVPLQDRKYRMPYTVVATFPDDEDASLRRSYNTLATLSELMMSDPSIRIELIGHSSPSPVKEAASKGLRRAQAVSDLLVAYGASADRIRVRSEGSSRPMFYFQQSEAQRALNNRVEMRMVIADELPYTITAEQVASEELATKAVAKWEERGYKAYFDPVVTEEGPAYIIRLWGYASLTEAQRAATNARKKYNAKASAD